MSAVNHNTLNARVDAFITASVAHATESKDIFTLVTAYTLKSGRMETLNKLATGISSADRASLVEFLMQLNKQGVAVLFGDDTDTAAALMETDGASDKGAINVITKDKEVGFKLGATPAAKAFRKAIEAKYAGDDETLAADMFPLMDKAEKAQDKRSADIFDSAAQLQKALKAIVAGEADPARAKRVATAINNVIRAEFGGDKAVSKGSLEDGIRNAYLKRNVDAETAKIAAELKAKSDAAVKEAFAAVDAANEPKIEPKAEIKEVPEVPAERRKGRAA